MKVIANGREWITLLLENREDIFKGSVIIIPGMLLRAKDSRSLEDEEGSKIGRESKIYTLSVSKVIMSRDHLRVTGNLITEGDGVKNIHTFNMTIGQKFSINTLEVPRYIINLLNQKDFMSSERIPYLAIDPTEYILGEVGIYGPKIIDGMERPNPKRILDNVGIYEKKLDEIVERYANEKIILCGPGNAKNKLINKFNVSPIVMDVNDIEGAGHEISKLPPNSKIYKEFNMYNTERAWLDLFRLPGRLIFGENPWYPVRVVVMTDIYLQKTPEIKEFLILNPTQKFKVLPHNSRNGVSLTERGGIGFVT